MTLSVTGPAVGSVAGMDDQSAHFYSGTISVDWSTNGGYSVKDAQDLAARLFPDKSLLEIGRLVGTPEGSTIVVTASDEGLMVLAKQAAKHIDLCRFFRIEEGLLTVYHWVLEIGQKKQGHGARILSRCVEEYRSAGVQRIDTFATGRPGAPSCGYCVWPLLGFNLTFSGSQRELVENAGFEARDTHELYLTYASGSEGRLWWEENGSPGNAVFDVDADSPHSVMLAAYLAERGIRT